MEAATTTQDTPPQRGVSSFSKSLFLGEIHEELVFPYPKPDDEEQQRIRHLVTQAREFGASYDQRAIEEARWIGDDKIQELGERGLMGLYVPTEYGGQGLSQTGYCRVSEEFAQIDATLSVIMGVHQSIGMKGIVLFGSVSANAASLRPLVRSGRRRDFCSSLPYITMPFMPIDWCTPRITVSVGSIWANSSETRQ